MESGLAGRRWCCSCHGDPAAHGSSAEGRRGVYTGPRLINARVSMLTRKKRKSLDNVSLGSSVAGDCTGGTRLPRFDSAGENNDFLLRGLCMVLDAAAAE